MSNRTRNGLTIFLLVLLTAGSFSAGYLTREIAGGGNLSLALAEDDLQLFQEAWGLIEGNFLGELPTSSAIGYAAIRGSLDTLDDPYTIFVEPADRDAEIERLQGHFGGVGAYIQRSEETGEIILEPIPGNPAEAAGLLTGDVLIAVDNVGITNEMTVPEIIELIKGEAGTAVILTLKRAGEPDPIDISVVRGDILLPSVAYQILSEDQTIGYIALSRFSGESGEEIQNAITELRSEGAKEFILDIRHNGGGLRSAAVSVIDHFLTEVPVLYTESKDEGEQVFNATTETVAPDDPLVVLVNGGTASASEIVAGALQDHQRATLIGDRTFGKGSVQFVFDLSDGSSIHVTSARWYTPDRHQIDQSGLEPDIAVEVTQDDVDNGRDPVLEAAIEALQNDRR